MNFFKFLFLALLVYLVVYYLFSPYQQCIREFDGSSIAINDFDRSPDQIQTQRRELLNIAKDGHKLECANTFQW